jgi:hypothetical protein
MLYLILSVVVLLVAPLIERLFRNTPHFEQVLSTFLMVVLGGIIFVELLPLSYQVGGWLVVPLVALGLSGPSIIERLFRKSANDTHQLTLLIGFSGLLLHTMIDGASLNEYHQVSSASQWLPLAIALHRIPVALTVLWIIRPVFGLKAVWLSLFSLALFTVFGYIVGVQLESTMTSQAFAWVQSFVSGTLLHVLLHRPHRHHHGEAHHHHSLLQQIKGWGKYHYSGVILGIVTLLVLAQIH